MKRWSSLSLAAALLTACSSLAQSPPVGEYAAGQAAPVLGVQDEYRSCSPTTFWAGADYIRWWARDHTFQPLIFTTPNDIAANLQTFQPSQGTPLFPSNGRSVDYGGLDGVRIFGGVQLGDRFGLDATGFVSSGSTRGSATASDGDPPLARTYISSTDGIFTALYLARNGAGATTGSISARAHLDESRGFDANLRIRGYSILADRTDLLVGFRYFRVGEDVSTNGRAQFQDGTLLDVSDAFQTRNRFYGGQIGVHSRFCNYGGFSFDATLKAALGWANQETTLTGSNSFTSPAGVVDRQETGLLVQSANAGRHERTKFVFLPEVTLNVNYRVMEHVTVFGGYNFLYVSNIFAAGYSDRPGRERQPRPIRRRPEGGRSVQSAVVHLRRNRLLAARHQPGHPDRVLIHQLPRRAGSGTIRLCPPNPPAEALLAMTRRLVAALALIATPAFCQTPVEIKAHTALVHSVAFSPDGKLFATAGFDKTAKVYDFVNGTFKEQRILAGHTDPVYCVAFSPDGKTLATSSLDKTIRLWTLADGKLAKELKGHTDIVDTIAFSPDGKLLASGSGTADKSIRLWNPADGKEVKNLGAHAGSVYSLAFSLDGKILVSSGADNLIKIWDLPGLKAVKDLKGHELGVTGVTFAGDNNTLLSISQDRTMRVWDVTAGKETKKFGPSVDDLYGLSWSNATKTVATAGYAGNISVWDLVAPKPTFTTRIKSPAYCATFAPDGKSIASGHDNGTVQFIKR